MMLDRIKIASPCSASWELMTGDDQVRFCSHCEKHVYNLSAMSRRDAEQFIRAIEGPVCTRFYRRPDGTILTEDCPVGLRAKAARVRRRLEFAVSGLFALAGLANAQQAPKPDPAAQVSDQNTAVLTGVVMDPINSVIANAVITITDQDHRASDWTAKSDQSGRFRIALPEGAYTITANVPGFLTLTKKDVDLRGKSASPTELKLQLQLGAMMGEAVEVVKTPRKRS